MNSNQDFNLNNTNINVHHDVQIDAFQKAFWKSSIGPDGDILGITPANLTKFLQNPQTDNYIIIDLRDTADLTTPTDRWQIRGAAHLPLSQTTTDPKLLNYINLCPKTTNDAITTQRAKGLWEQFLKSGFFPIESARTKQYVFFHCKQSLNRTPAVATGYKRYVSPPGQSVIIIEGGFDAYQPSVNAQITPWTGQLATKASDFEQKVMSTKVTADKVQQK